VKALSIKQPWLDAIVRGEKAVENRSWLAPRWAVGKQIALHASKGYDEDAVFPSAAMRKSWDIEPHQVVRGAVLAVATIASCHEWCAPLCSPWGVMDQCHWVLSDVRELGDPLPCRGALGLWNLPFDIEDEIRVQLETEPAV
jgi:hypothetical protein